MKMYSLKDRIDYYWRKACAFDRINPRETFVVFSYRNPYTKVYSLLIKEMLKREQ